MVYLPVISGVTVASLARTRRERQRGRQREREVKELVFLSSSFFFSLFSLFSSSISVSAIS
jgi:hypothetical protein